MRSLVPLVLLLAATAALADDLTVTHISRLPELDYVWGSASPTRDGWPAPGQEIVWRANVKNFSASALTSGYRWTLDGVTVARGTQTFAPDATTPVDLPSTWSFERHRLAFDVDAVPGEESASNNRLEVFTDALSVGLWVEQPLYDYFRAHQRDLGIGSTCWENWAQRLVGFYNDMAAMAVYPRRRTASRTAGASRRSSSSPTARCRSRLPSCRSAGATRAPAARSPTCATVASI